MWRRSYEPKKWQTAISCALAALVYVLNWPIYTNSAGEYATLLEINGLGSLVGSARLMGLECSCHG